MGPLNHSQAQIIQQLLVDLGVGTLPESNGDWPVWYDKLPDQPDNAILVNNTQGRFGGRVQISGQMVEAQGFIVRIRSDNIVDGYVKGRQILNKFDSEVNREQVVVQDSTYLVHAITRTSDVNKVTDPRTDSKRDTHAINATVTIFMIVDGGTGS